MSESAILEHKISEDYPLLSLTKMEEYDQIEEYQKKKIFKPVTTKQY